MPMIEDAPDEMNNLMEKIHQACMKQQGSNEEKCSRVAMTAAKNEGWHKDKNGKWIK